MKDKNFEEKKYKLELEIVELSEQSQPQKMARMAKRSLKKLVLNKIDGKMGEC